MQRARSSPTLRIKERQVAGMLHQATDPMSAPLLRLKSPGAQTPVGTAVGKVFYNTDINWTVLDSPNIEPHRRQPGTLGNIAVPLLDDITHYPFILTHHPIISAIYRVDSKVTGTVPQDDFTYIVGKDFVGLISLEAGAEEHIGLTSQIRLSGTPLLGDFVPGMVVASTPVTYFDGYENLSLVGSRLTVTVRAQTNIGASTMYLRLMIHDEVSSDVAAAQVVPAVTTGNTVDVDVTIPYSGYFSLVVQNAGNAEEGVSIDKILYKGRMKYYMRHLTLHTQQELNHTINTARVNGSSMLLTNTAPEMMKQGIVHAAQFPASTPWLANLTLESFAMLNPTISTRKSWVDGLYTFCKPQGGADTRGVNDFVPTLAGVSAPATDLTATFIDTKSNAVYNFNPFDFGGYVGALVVPTVSPGLSQIAPTSACNLTICNAIEFTTRQQLFNVGQASIMTQQFDNYVDALSAIPQFYENPFHMSDIWKGIRAAAQRVVEFTEDVVKVAGTIGSIAAFAATAMA